jgi:hypothetical protein
MGKETSMKWTAGAILFLSAAAPAVAQDEIIGFRVREWFARMGGEMEADNGSGTSQRIDLGADLGLADRNLTHELQAYLRIPILGRIYAGWWRAHDTGSETITRTFDFAGFTFTSSSTVNSEVTLDVGYLTYEFAFPTLPIGGDYLGVELAVQLSGRVLRGDGMIEETSSGNGGSDSGVVGLPTLGGHVTVTLFSLVRAEIEVVGLAFKYADWRIHYVEASAEVVAQPLPWFFAGVGYKMTNLDFRKNGNEKFLIDVTVSGIYITAGLRF